MKRMSPQDRKSWVANHYSKLYLDLTCRVGAWSRDKLLNELENTSDSFVKILRRKNISQKLRMLEI